MRHKGVDKETTRLKVTEAAGRKFRKHGYAGVGIDALAKAAGVTSGAIYGHFGSKVGAFDSALEAGLDEVLAALPSFQAKGDSWLADFCDYYLGLEHQQDLECGCAMASLTPEVIKFDSPQKHLYESKMQSIADQVAKGLKGDDTLGRAWAVLASLIGGLNVLRALHSDALKKAMVVQLKAQILAMAESS
jgi:TetR/AcrR family transcriptional repressor of nem operon